MIKFSVFLVGNDSGAISTSHSHGKQHCLPISRFTVDLKSSTTTNPSLSASEFLDRVAALIPPPRKHRHCYFGVLAPNSPLRAQVAANAGRKPGAGSKAPRPKTVRTDLAPRGQDTRRDICWCSASRASTGCLRSSAAGAAGGCAMLGSSRSRRRCGRYWNM